MAHPAPSMARYDADLFDAPSLADPYPHYRELRNLGPLVWLSVLGMPAMSRYADVRAALADDGTFISGEGVLLNDTANQLTRGTTLASDTPEHENFRQVVAHRLTPRALRGERDRIDVLAKTLVDRVVDAGEVDGVIDVARAMPMAVVPDFIGFPDDCRDRLLEWAGAAIEVGGPVGEHTPAAAKTATELGQYAASLTQEHGFLPGSLGEDLLQAADRGEVTPAQCPALVLDYFGPSLETTISAIGSALALFATHPEQWDLLRADPSLIGGALNEVLRLESPLRGFSRVAARDTVVGDVPLAAGTRVLLLFGSANRDERRWSDPDTFDITRENADHLGFGYGVHGCAGQGLARLEMAAVLTQLAARVRRIELTAEPVRRPSSMIRAFDSIPLRLIAA